MALDRDLLGRLRTKGEQVFQQLSAELGQNERFTRAMAGALRGKEKLEEAAGRALRQMNVPTRSELKRALARIDALEREVAALRARARGTRSARRTPSGGARRKAAG